MAKRGADRLRILQREAEQLAAQERTLLADLRKLEIERQIKIEEVQRQDAALAENNRELTALNTQIERLEQTVGEQRPVVASRLVELYKLGRPGYLRLLLNVSDARSIGRAYRSVSVLARADRQRLVQHRDMLQKLSNTRMIIQDRLVKATELQTEARRARDALDRAVSSRSALVRSIDERRDLTAQLASELEEAHQRLQSTLTGLTRGDALTEEPSLPLRPFKGALSWPASAPTLDAVTRVRSGIEVPISEGTAIKAVHDGRVEYADVFTGFGNLVIIEHAPQTYSLYGYLSSPAVQSGAHVAAGQVVGASGLSPVGDAALFFELRIDGKPVNPLEWLKR